MKRIITIMLAVCTLAPVSTSAIVVNTSASSHTGGVTAQPGEAVTSESSDASVHIQTVIVADERGDTADVQVTTVQNGAESVEKKHYDTRDGMAGEIRVSATSSAKARASDSSSVGVASATPGTIATSSHRESIFFTWANRAPRAFSDFLTRILSFFAR